MLTLFQAQNTVAWLPSSLYYSNAIATVLLVASCVDGSLLVHTVRDYSAYNFDSYEIDQQTGGGRSDAPDKDRSPPSFQEPFHAPSTPTNRGREPTSPGSTLHSMVWKPKLAEVCIQR